MSKSVHREGTEAHAPRNRQASYEALLQTTQKIDTVLERLREQIIPPQPYLLSVPSDVPYRHSSHFVDNWFLGTPFSIEEEPLQYLSFLSHNGEENSLLKVVGGWADERGNLIEEDTPSPASLSGRNTPVEQPSRKKISLKDYKIKDKTRPSTPTTNVPTEDLRKQVMKSEAREHGVKVEEDRKISSPAAHARPKKDQQVNLKVDQSQLDGSQKSKMQATSNSQDFPSPRKKRRLSSDSIPKENAPSKGVANRDSEESKHLPSLLSPTLPAQQKTKSSKDLPGLLLPDLPPALEKLIAKVDGKAKDEAHSSTRTESVKTILGNALGTTASKRPIDKAGNEASSNRVRSDSQNSIKTATNTPKVQSPAIKPLLKSIARPVTPSQNGVVASPRPRQRHIIVLRYGKKNRKSVQALLKFAPRPKKLKSVIEEPVRKLVEHNQVSGKSVAEPEKSERKRPVEKSPERPVKKVKQLETPEKLKAPNAPINKPQAEPPTSSKPKFEAVTPKKELKSSAMRRIESQDEDVRTPQPDRGRNATPVHSIASSQAKASPGPSSSISKEDRAAWQEMNSKFYDLGRTLKHEGTSLGPSPANDRGDKDSALSVILLIEALICFMLNHTALSQARPKVDPGWSTIIPYHIFVFKASRKFRHLHGLVIQLGAICRQAMHNLDIERLARDPLPFEQCESAPTPGSDGNTRQNEDAEKYKKRYVGFRDQMVSNARELQSAWLDGSRYLSPALIEREYPKTWARRTKDTSKRGFEKLKPGAIGREFYLPLDVSSTAFEATRFSLSFMKEWSEKEKINWNPRIEL